MEDWQLYMIRTENGSLYTGIARDVDRRFEEHRSGAPAAAKFFRGKGPLELVFRYQVGNRSQALKAEAVVKKLRKPEKEKLVRGELRLDALLAAGAGAPGEPAARKDAGG